MRSDVVWYGSTASCRGAVLPSRGATIRGYTLIEVLVVLVVMSIAVALVGPTLVTRHQSHNELRVLIREVRAVAIRRAETVTLRIEASGSWRADGVVTEHAGAIASGRLSAPTVPLVVVFSPLGSCGPDVETAAGGAIGLDLLLCEVATP